MKPEPAPPSRIEAFKLASPVGTSGRDWLDDNSSRHANRAQVKARIRSRRLRA